MVNKVGAENFAQNSSINGKSVGIYAAVEKMFSLGGEESGIGQEWLDNVQDVFMPIFINPIDENDSVEFDADDLASVKQMREKLATTSRQSLEGDKRLAKFAEGRTLRDGTTTINREESLSNVIDSFIKAYTEGKDAEGNDYGKEFHYQLAKLAVSFAETKSNIAESDSVLKQLKALEDRKMVQF